MEDRCVPFDLRQSPRMGSYAWPSPGACAWIASACTEPASSLASAALRSEEHTSELQSPSNLVCRLLLEKKKTPFNQILKQNAKREMRLRLGKVTLADVLAAQPVTTNLLKFIRASIKMIGVSKLQSFIAYMTQKLTLSDISDESKNYLDKAGITTACLRIKSKWTAGGK